MYAVIETGGKQYRVEVGTELEIELLEAGPGETVAFDRVLLVADGDAASIGRPLLANAAVAAEVIRRERGEKVISFKYRPKARRRVKKGHRQELTLVRINDIVLEGRSAAKEAQKAEDTRLTERQRLEEAARRQAAKDAELAAKLAADQAESTPAGRSTKAGTSAKSSGTAKSSSTRKASTTKAKAETADTTEAKDTDAGTTKRARASSTSSTSSKRTTAASDTAKPAPKTGRSRTSDKD